jgi:hypothetical protein
MKKITEIINIGENKISFAQSSKGYWYCSDITIICSSVSDGLILMNSSVDRIIDILKDKNKIIDGKESE